MGKTALITGITGQDGAYLAEHLLRKGYQVHGIRRRSSLFNTNRIDHLYKDPHISTGNFVLHYGDLTDSCNLVHIVQTVQPDEIYNMGAQSHVHVSFEQPEYTANVDGTGTLRLLEAIRILGMEKMTRFYQASTSESTAWCSRLHKTRKRRFIHARPTPWPSFTHTGLQSITGKPTVYMHVTVYFSIMNPRCAGRHL